MTAKRSHNLDSPMAVDVLRHGVERALQLSSLVTKQRMQQLAPIDTGRMERSVTQGPVVWRGSRASIIIRPTVHYAKYTELEPWVIGKRPGPKSRVKGATLPWIKPATRETAPEVKRLFSIMVKDLARDLGRRYRPIV